MYHFLSVLCVSLSLFFHLTAANAYTQENAFNQQKFVISKHDDAETLQGCETIVVKVYKALNIDIEILNLPGERALFASNAGQTDAELCRIAGLTKSYPNLVQVEPALESIIIVAVSLDPDVTFHDVQSLQGYSLGSVRGMKAAENYFQLYNIQYVYDYLQVVKLLNEGLIDFAILPLNDVLLAQAKMPEKNFIIHQPPLFVHQLHHYVHKRHQDLLPALQTEINKLTKY